MSVAEQAKQVYESDLRATCESQHFNRFIAIEPISRAHFIADQFVDAALAASQAYPDRETFVIRIGHKTAFHLGRCEA